jgi:signal transduction protein with GAF and PtsI domain
MTKKIAVERLNVVSSKPFEDILKVIDAAIGHPDVRELQKAMAASKSYPEMESLVHNAVGATNLMEFMRFDLGKVISKDKQSTSQSVRLLVGNPLIMRQMAELVPDAGSYAPVTILIDERADGVHLSYDKMASFLAPYKNADALKVAKDLDLKIETLLTTAAS